MNQGLPFVRLGILGGGQLGRMGAMAARSMGVELGVLDPGARPPAHGLASQSFQGELDSKKDIENFVAHFDVISYEIEHIDVEVLKALEAGGATFHPRPRVLEIIQDKLVQKKFLADHGLPVPAFFEELPNPPSYPVVQKMRKGGYDGRGVTILRSKDDEVFSAPSMFEACVDIDKELAVIVARSPSGEIAVYPVVEMVFDPRAQICSSVLAPARVSAKIEKTCFDLAHKIALSLDLTGLLAVELFLTKKGEILINELAPRPHNSGHWTIEGAATSQFEQQIRAVLDLPLGKTDLIKPSLMINLLGELGSRGRPIIEGYKEAMAIGGLSMHWYQKAEVKENRKMGHITLIGDSVDEVLKKGLEAQNILRIKGDA